MFKKDKSKDKHMNYICTDIVKPAQPLTSAWVQILKLEYYMKEEHG